MQGIYTYIPEKNMSVGNTVLQLFYCYYSLCLYRYYYYYYYYYHHHPNHHHPHHHHHHHLLYAGYLYLYS